MKNKEKEIEEIAKDMSKELCGYYDKRKRKCTNCFGMEEDCDLHCNFGRTLERLSEAGYRKIDKDSIVISTEEYKCLKSIEKSYDPFWFCAFDGCEGACKECKNTCEMSIFVKERKETAERYKIAMILSIQEMQKYSEITEEQAKLLYYHNYQVAKQFGVK